MLLTGFIPVAANKPHRHEHLAWLNACPRHLKFLISAAALMPTEPAYRFPPGP